MSVRIEKISGTYAQLLASENVVLQGDKILTFFHPAARYKAKHKRGGWDGKIHFLKYPKGFFPVGFSYRLASELRKLGHSVQLSGFRMQCEPRFPENLFDVDLRPYQVNAANIAMKSLGGVALQIPTGGGKTLVGAEIVRRSGVPALWIVNGIDLMYQTRKVLRKVLNCDVGILGDGKAEDGDVMIGIVNTLSSIKDKDFWNAWGCLIVDEAHLASAPTWFECAMKCQYANIRVGLSGTMDTKNPLRNARIEAALGPTVIVVKHDELVEDGHLARAKIVLLRPDRASYPSHENIRDTVCPDWRKSPQLLTTKGGQLFGLTYERGIVQNEARNNLIKNIVMREVENNKRVLVACKRTFHGITLQKMIPGSRFLHGEHKSMERLAVLDAFKRSQFGDCLIASEIFKIGIDAPEIDVLVIATGGKSAIDVLQWVGRALRPRGDKQDATIYDFIDGRIDSKKDYLSAHSTERIEEYGKAGFVLERWS
jgi:superfamily II DNA or RNA helicase